MFFASKREEKKRVKTNNANLKRNNADHRRHGREREREKNSEGKNVKNVTACSVTHSTQPKKMEQRTARTESRRVDPKPMKRN